MPSCLDIDRSDARPLKQHRYRLRMIESIPFLHEIIGGKANNNRVVAPCLFPARLHELEKNTRPVLDTSPVLIGALV